MRDRDKSSSVQEPSKPGVGRRSAMLSEVGEVVHVNGKVAGRDKIMQEDRNICS